MSNLPASRQQLIGREADLIALRKLVLGAESRLVTCTGAGGCGKTSLALEVARGLLQDVPDGIWLVELATLADPSLVPALVAEVFGVQEGPARPLLDGLLAYLESRRVLILLDNCEHLLDACADFVNRVLSACPQVRILATSREPLRVAGERTWRVASLETPEPDRLPPLADLAGIQAVRLFVERARAVQPRFELTPQNARAVAQVCARLDGLPLALELAAARVRGLAVEQVAARLDDTFAIAAGGSRTTPSRQQTLRATLDWSNALLSAPEAALFRRLAVFTGRWTLESAEAVSSGEDVEPAEVLDVLLRLVDKSLVVADEWDGEARYRFAEPIRQYALERLEVSSETDALRRRHAGYYLGLAERAAEGWPDRTLGAPWLTRMEREHDNLRGALAWADEVGDVGFGQRLAGALWQLWRIHGHFAEGLRWFEALLPRGDTVPPGVRARALMAAGNLAWARGHAKQARAWLDEALALYRVLGDSAGTAGVLVSLGDVAAGEGAYTSAQALLEEALTLARQGSQAFVAGSLHDLGELSLYRGDYDAASARFEESLAIGRQAGDEYQVARALGYLGRIAGLQGDQHRAAILAADGLRILRGLGARREMAECLEVLAAAAGAYGRTERAARLFGAVEALRDAISAPRPEPDGPAYDRTVAAIRDTVGEKAFAAAWVEGRALGTEAAVAEALAVHDDEPRGPPGREHTVAVGGLTAREQQVAVLVAQGLSNRQVAAALVIAAGTADRHLSNILNKLGLNSRAALAAWAVGHGLLAHKRQ